MDKMVKYINECREMGISVHPPDVNQSDLNFTPAGDAIRFGLGAVKNVGQGAVEAIVAARTEGGPFNSIYNFCERINLGAVNRRVIESLIKAGALDSVGGNRAQLTEALDRALESGLRASRDRTMGQHGLFGMLGEEEKHEYPLAQLQDWTMEQKLTGEKEVLGIYVSGHPLGRFKDKISDLATHFTDKLEGLEKGVEVKLCGILTNIVRKTNREGKYWAALKLDDGRGTADAMVFANRYEELLAGIKGGCRCVSPRVHPAGRRRSAEAIDSGNGIPRRGSRGSAVGYFHPYLAARRKFPGESESVERVVYEETGQYGSPATAGKTARLFSRNGCHYEGTARPRISRRAGKNLRTGINGSSRHLNYAQEKSHRHDGKYGRRR